MQDTMHTFESNSSNVPAFLIKLWKLVEDPSCDELIAWSENGLSFIIRDQSRFAKELLPQYFKHNNMASFIRQLNMYGFRKVMNYEKTELKNEKDEMEFQHSFFLKEQVELLDLIKRKIPNNKFVEPYVKSNAKDILTDLTSIREKQENMDTMLNKMKQENELLWRELTSMRQKHKTQEQIIQKVIQFLVSVLQRSNNPNIGVQRKITRMLQDSPASKLNSQQILMRKKNNQDCIVVPEVVSPLGPVIHEVTDQDENQIISAYLVTSPSSSKNIDSVKSPDTVNSNLNSPLDASATMEPQSILEPLQTSTPIENSEECVLGLPLEYISDPSSGIANTICISSSDEPISNTISIPEGTEVSDLLKVPVSTSDKSDGQEIDSNAILIPEFEVIADLADCLDLPPGTSAQSLLPYASKNELENLLSTSLNTPQINVDGEEQRPFKKLKKESEDSTKSTVSEHNCQLALNDHSKLKKTSDLSKNQLSSHLLNVEENLSWLRDHMSSDSFKDQLTSSNSWNLDDSKLLGLFSTYDLLDDTLTSEITDGINGKNDIVGNELVQFYPNLLECDLGVDQNTPFFDILDEASKAMLGSEGADLDGNTSLAVGSEGGAIALPDSDADVSFKSPVRRRGPTRGRKRKSK